MKIQHASHFFFSILYSVLFLISASSVVYAAPDRPHTALSPDPLPTYVTASFSVHTNFTLPVATFGPGSITVTNGSVTAFATSSGTGKDYDFTVTPAADGAVSVLVAENAALTSDEVGNVASNQLDTTYDGTVPTVTLASTSTSPTGLPMFVVATFSEAVSGFDALSVTVVNGAVSGFTAASSALYSFVVTPATDGTTTISVATGAAQDVAVNGNTASNELAFLFSNAPLATISFLDAASSSASSFHSGETIVVSVVFSEPVVDVPATTIGISGPDALATTTMAKTDSTHYTYSYTAGASGGTDVVWVDGAQDLTGNPQTAATSSITIIANTPPPPPAAPSSGGGGGGGGFSSGGGGGDLGGGLVLGASIGPSVSTSTATPSPSVASTTSSQAGEVLGVQVYRFSRYLIYGSRGADVIELQKRLIAATLLSSDSNTGYFGPLTRRAVMTYQKNHKLPQTGTVGPLTRGVLNTGGL